MNRELIKKLSSGEIAVKNDGTLDQLKAVLKEAFPNDEKTIRGFGLFYFKNEVFCDKWDSTSSSPVFHAPIKDFFTEEWKPETGDLVLAYGKPMTFIGDTDDPYNPYLCCMPNDYNKVNLVVCKVDEIQRIPKPETISTEEAEKMLEKMYHKPFKIKS